MPEQAGKGPRQGRDEALLTLATSVAESFGLQVYDLVVRRSGPRWKLQVFIEASGRAITLDDCETVSRQLSRELDVLDPIAHAYDLEVSSPGIERALRHPRHWVAAVGGRVFVRYREPDGGTRALVAEVLEADDARVRLRGPDKIELELTLDAVSTARMHADWD